MSLDLKQKIDFINKNSSNNLINLIGIKFIKIEPTEVIAEININQDHHQPFGIMHGGVSLVLSESLASIGAWLNLDNPDQLAVGQEINANHLKPVITGKIIGYAHPIHIGKTSQVWEISIKNNDKLICISRSTIAIVQKK